jgi:hypothetical protein
MKTARIKTPTKNKKPQEAQKAHALYVPLVVSFYTLRK